MQRRDFLVATGGLVAASLSAGALAQVSPCPPPSLNVAGGTSATTPCNVASGVVVPTWTSSPVL